MPPANNIERRARRKKQTRLTFDPLEAAPTSSTSGATASTSYSPAKVRYEVQAPTVMSGGSPSKTRSGKAKASSTLLPTPVKSSQFQNAGMSNAEAFDVASDDESDVNIYSTSRRINSSSPPIEKRDYSRLSKHHNMGLDGASDSSEGSSPEDFPEKIPKSKKRKTPKKKTTKSIAINSDEESEMDLARPKRTPNRRAGSTFGASSGSSKKSRRQKPLILSDDSEDELAAPPSRRAARGRKSKNMRPAEEAVSLEDDSDEIVGTSALKRTPKPIVIDEEEEDEDEDSEEIFSPLKRRRRSTTDLDSDLEVSPSKRPRGGSTASKTPIRVTRQQRPKKRTVQEKTMELMRRRRAGEKIDELTASESEDEDKAAMFDTDSDLQALSEFEDESEGEKEKARKARKAEKARRARKQVISDDEDDFITDDEEGTLGVPTLGLHEIPFQFTSQAHKPLKEHFKDAVEWLIHNKINPAFSRDDAIYRIAFQRLDDEVSGYASSKFVSSAWAADFSKAIYARPIYLDRELDAPALDLKCSACNRSNHPPTFVIQLQGKAYSKDTLVEIEQDSEDSDDSDRSVNSKGQSLPGEATEWFVGRFCKANAYTAHRLIHWKYALNEWVLENLDQKNYLTPAKVVARAKMKRNRLKKEANQIVDEWAAEGTIKSLYGDFKQVLEDARKPKQEGRWGK